MAKKRKINPCTGKSKLFHGLGSQSGSFFYNPDSGERVAQKNCCEIFQEGLTNEADFRLTRIYYAEKTDPATQGHGLIPISHPSNCPAGYRVVVPCQGQFRYADSPGTLAFKAKLGTKTNFSGCQSLEEDWYFSGDGVYELHPNETLGGEKDLREAIQDEVDTKGMLNDSNSPEYVQLLYSMDREDGANIDFNTAAQGWKELHILLENWKFSTEAGASGSLGLNIHPYSDGVFEFLQSKATKLRVVEKRFSRFLKGLTSKQRRAFKDVHLQNYELIPYSEIAKQIGISIDSLQDRLNGAYKKLYAAFPEFSRPKGQKIGLIHKRRSRGIKKEIRLPALITRTNVDGNVTRHHFTKIKEQPFGDPLPKNLSLAEVARIKAAIRKESAAKLEFLKKTITFFNPRAHGKKLPKDFTARDDYDQNGGRALPSDKNPIAET